MCTLEHDVVALVVRRDECVHGYTDITSFRFWQHFKSLTMDMMHQCSVFYEPFIYSVLCTFFESSLSVIELRGIGICHCKPEQVYFIRNWRTWCDQH